MYFNEKEDEQMNGKSLLTKRFPYKFFNVTLGLIILNVGLFLIDQLIKGGLSSNLSVNPFKLQQTGYYWQFFTYMFMHADWNHVLFNMLALFIFGYPLEERLGSYEFLLYYLLIGLLTGIVSIFLYMNMDIYVLGASGAIFGLLLAYATLFPDARILFFMVIPIKAPVAVLIFTLLSIFYIFTGTGGNVAHEIHLAGLIFGYLYFLIRYRINPINIFTRKK